MLGQVQRVESKKKNVVTLKTSTLKLLRELYPERRNTQREEKHRLPELYYKERIRLEKCRVCQARVKSLHILPYWPVRGW